MRAAQRCHSVDQWIQNKTSHSCTRMHADPVNHDDVEIGEIKHQSVESYQWVCSSLQFRSMTGLLLKEKEVHRGWFVCLSLTLT